MRQLFKVRRDLFGNLRPLSAIFYDYKSLERVIGARSTSVRGDSSRLSKGIAVNALAGMKSAEPQNPCRFDPGHQHQASEEGCD